MITYNCIYTKKEGCTNCKHKNNCDLLKPSSSKHIQLLNEIKFWLKEWKQSKKNINNYFNVLNDIQNNKYAIPINVYGNIQFAPETNVFSVFIKRPEHIYYGWNYHKLKRREKELKEKLRILNKKELNMRHILERKQKRRI